MVGLLAALPVGASAANGIVLPDGFELQVVAGGFSVPTGMAIAPNGRIFVTEKRGYVWLIDDGTVLSLPFIDLVDEVGDVGDLGLLGIALDPDFASTPWVYLLYVVDPSFNQPNDGGAIPSFGRLVRYLADPATKGTTALLSSRLVLLGAKPNEGFIHCHTSHGIGTLRFASDGTLFVGAGDGAHFDFMDSGGEDPACFESPLFDPIHDIGAFRAQYHGSMAGKILRIDRTTGQGLPSNPFWTGDAADVESKVWVTGLRNPFRFAVRPDTGLPETLYVGDVGWFRWEEVNVAYGGENFGWPCYEGFAKQPEYFNAQPTHSGCDSIETPPNPGPLKGPVISWHHSDPDQSTPPGFTGSCAVGGVFYTGTCYPPEYHGRYFFADWVQDWIHTLEVDANDQFVSLAPFATGANRPVAFDTDPATGDVCYVAIMDGKVRRIVFPQPPADSDLDCDVDRADFAAFQRCFTGQGGTVRPQCRMFDTDGDEDVDLADFNVFLELFTGPL